MAQVKVEGLLLAILVIGARSDDIARKIFDETPKCIPPLEVIPIILNCYKDVTGQAFDHKTTKLADITYENKISILTCAGKLFGMISQDEKTFNVDTALMAVDMSDATDEVKAAWGADLKDCAAKGGDVHAIVVCGHEAFVKNCS